MSKPIVKVKCGWLNLDGKRIYFRSGWEARYAKYLTWLKRHKKIVEWEHEPKTFWFEGIKRGCVSYLPDFRVDDCEGNSYWVEVKGWMDAKSKTKIKRFRKYYPHEKLIVIDGSWFRKNGAKIDLLARQVVSFS